MEMTRSVQETKSKSRASWTLDALAVFTRGRKASAKSQSSNRPDDSLQGPSLETDDLKPTKQAWCSKDVLPSLSERAAHQTSVVPGPGDPAFRSTARKTSSTSLKEDLAGVPNADLEDEASSKSDEDSLSESSSHGHVVLNPYQEDLIQALDDRNVHTVLSWESRGLVEVPQWSVAICIATGLPSENDARDLVEEMVSRKIAIPIFVLLMRSAKQANVPGKLLAEETRQFLELGTADVVLQPLSEDPEACVDMWLARAGARAAINRRVLKKAKESEQEIEGVIQTASEREDALFWEQTHVLFHGIPRLNPTLQEPVVDGMLGSHHRVLELINAGAFSDVFLVRDGKRQLRAMKAVKKEKLGCFDLVKCVSNEVQILRRLRHSHVVRFHGSAQSREHVIILLELVGKRNLFNFLKAHDSGENVGAPFETPQARTYFHQMVSALGYCHREGISHRDIKPENFAVSDDLENIKLVDFGMAAELEAPLKHKGTMPFVSPEVIEEDHAHYDAAAADMWSLGVVLVEVVCGLHALSRMLKWKSTTTAERSHAADLRGMLGAPGKLRAGLKERVRPSMHLSSDLDDLIHGMLSLSPATRWTAQMVLQSPWLPSPPPSERP